jgi:hypothetical protein
MKTTLRATIVVSCFFLIALLSRCGGSPTLLAPPQPLPLVITSGATPAGSAGSEYGGGSGFSLPASGGIPPYKWSWAAAAKSSLPPGLPLSKMQSQVP